MKTPVLGLATDDIAWESINDDLQFKLLNGDRNAGSHTMLLESAPRARSPFVGQYHAVSEEFYCIDGDFTFDGIVDFGPGSYAYYPAFCVHGASVHVRGGYSVIVRMGGKADIVEVRAPETKGPYLLEQAATGALPVQLPSPAAQLDRSPGRETGLFVTQVLRCDEVSGAGCMILIGETDESETAEVSLQCKEVIELFILSGTFVAGGAHLGTNTYSCVPSGEQVTLRCLNAGRILIMHDATLITRFAN